MKQTPEHTQAETTCKAWHEGKAFRRAVEPVLPRLRWKLGQMVPRAMVEDLVQETLLAAWERADTLQEPQKIGAWLAAIGRRKAIDWLRRHQRPLPPALVESEVCPKPSPEGQLARLQSLSLMREAVTTLPPRQQSVIQMRVLEEQTTRNAAQTLQISEKTVYATEAQARARLKKSPMVQRAWEVLSMAGMFVGVFWTRLKSAGAWLTGAAWRETGSAGWSKASTAVWTCLVGAASVSGWLVLQPASRSSAAWSIQKDAFSTASARGHVPKGKTLLMAPAMDAHATPPASRRHRLQTSIRTLRPAVSKQRRRVMKTRAERIKTMKNLKRMARVSVLAAALIAVPQVVQAKPKAKTPKAKTTVKVVKGGIRYGYKKVTKLDMTGDTLTGELSRPLGKMFTGRRRLLFNSLIKVRRNFRGRLNRAVKNL